MSEKRHFTIIYGNKEKGLFIGRSPISIARKVVSHLSNGKNVIFSLREITQGSKKKVYGPYEGIKKKLKEPRKVGDRIYKYESIVRRIEKKGGEIDKPNASIFIEKKNEKSEKTDILNIKKYSKNIFKRSKLSALKYIKNKFSEENKEESKFKITYASNVNGVKLNNSNPKIKLDELFEDLLLIPDNILIELKKNLELKKSFKEKRWRKLKDKIIDYYENRTIIDLKRSEMKIYILDDSFIRIVDNNNNIYLILPDEKIVYIDEKIAKKKYFPDNVSKNELQNFRNCLINIVDVLENKNKEKIQNIIDKLEIRNYINGGKPIDLLKKKKKLL